MNQKNYTSAIIITTTYVLIITCLAYTLASLDVVNPFDILTPAFLVLALVVLGFFSVIMGLRFLRNKNFTIGIILIIISVLSFPPVSTYLAKRISAIFVPFLRNGVAASIRYNNEAYRNQKEEDYKYYIEKFQNPQKIIQAKYNKLLTEDYTELVAYQVSRNDSSFASYAQNKLVGMYINIKLPNHDDFIRSYISGAHDVVFDNIDNFRLKEKDFHWGGDVPVLIYVDGTLINNSIWR